MRRTGSWITIMSILLLSIALSAISCSSYSDFSHEYYGGDTMNGEMLSEILESLFADTKEDETGISESGLIAGETREEFINGFCRTTNESRTVCCEYERQPDGEWTLTDYECNVDKCPNSAACQIYKEAREKGNTYEKLFQ